MRNSIFASLALQIEELNLGKHELKLLFEQAMVNQLSALMNIITAFTEVLEQFGLHQEKQAPLEEVFHQGDEDNLDVEYEHWDEISILAYQGWLSTINQILILLDSKKQLVLGLLDHQAQFEIINQYANKLSASSERLAIIICKMFNYHCRRLEQMDDSGECSNQLGELLLKSVHRIENLLFNTHRILLSYDEEAANKSEKALYQELKQLEERWGTSQAIEIELRYSIILRLRQLRRWLIRSRRPVNQNPFNMQLWLKKHK